jgi:DNA polymerase-3 subunit alpha
MTRKVGKVPPMATTTAHIRRTLAISRICSPGGMRVKNAAVEPRMAPPRMTPRLEAKANRISRKTRRTIYHPPCNIYAGLYPILSGKGAADLAVPLFIHSDYSLLESTVTIPNLVRRIHELGYDAVGLADHNTTGGHVELARECQKYGIAPLFGLELDVTYPEPLGGSTGGASSRLVFFAKGQEGYRSLLELCSLTPPVGFQQLAPYAQNLIMCSGGVLGQLYALVAAGKRTELKNLVAAYDQLFGPNWFVQLEWDTPTHFRAAQELAAACGEQRCVAGQHVCFLDPEDSRLLAVLTAFQQGVGTDAVSITARPLLARSEFVERFRGLPQALANTNLLKEMCSFDLPRQQGLPRLPEEVDFRQAVLEGARQRYGELEGEVEDRIAHELAVIQEMGLADYFLVVADIVRFAKQQGIPVGPGRGSAASSAVAYCLGITSVDPIAYGLVFERFLNRARHSLPDIDLDFCYARRGEVLEYVQRRFDPDRVALIGTYGTFGEKTAEQVVRRTLRHNDDRTEVSALIARLAGLKRNFSTHASGVIISTEPITCYQAVRTDRAIAVTHGDMHSLEWQGLLKIDLLGLRTLTFLKQAETEVQKHHPDFSLETIPLADTKTFALLGRGDTGGIFQLESELFQDLLRRMQPQTFLELSALLALGRPGPLSLFPLYLKNRAAPEKVRYAHPLLKEILGETYGLAVYQEQVIQLGHRLGGMNRSEADLLRIAISKKDAGLINKLAESFISGCMRSGLKAEQARELFAAIRKFAGYAFNKAHSVCYALISWRAAYLKAHFPTEFLCCSMEGHSGSTLEPYLKECKRLGVPIYPPDVHMSEVSHRAEGSGIRLGLTAIKHVGAAAARLVVDGRQGSPYQNLQDFRRRVKLPDHTVQALVQGGAFDSLGKRMELCAQLGIGVSDGLSMLKAERELIGAYLSDHPAARFTTFLRQISGGLAFAAGEITRIRESGGVLAGEVEDPSGFVKFVLPAAAAEGMSLEAGSLLAVFGSMQGSILNGKQAFPLAPTLILRPRDDGLLDLQSTLARYPGSTPVVLRLGRDVLHILPPSYWVKWGPMLKASLEECCLTVQLFDPW